MYVLVHVLNAFFLFSAPAVPLLSLSWCGVVCVRTAGEELVELDEEDEVRVLALGCAPVAALDCEENVLVGCAV